MSSKRVLWRVTARPPRGKDGQCWQLRYWPPEGEGRPGKPGKPYQRSAGTTDGGEAWAMAAQEERRLNDGVSFEGIDRRLALGEALLECFRRYVEAQPLADTTKTKYRQVARRLAPLLNPHLLSTRTLVLTRDRLLADGLKAATINQMLVAAKAAWTWAAERGLVEDAWPPLRSLRVAHTDLRPATPAEVALILRAARTYQGGRYFALFLLVSATGARVGETCSLRERDIDREAGEIRFQARVTKSRKPRTVAVPPQVLAQVERRPDPDALLFPSRCGTKPLSSSAAYSLWKRVVRMVGLEGERLGGFHALRRTWIVRAFVEGVGLAAVMRHVGHSAPSVTLTYQRLAVDAGEREAAATVARSLGLIGAEGAGAPAPEGRVLKVLG